MKQFTVTTARWNRFCEETLNDLCIPSHLTPDQAAEFAMDHFKRTLLSELELLEVSCIDHQPK
jgi:hypothetical protein